MLLTRLNIVLPKELPDKAFGISLSDQYWIKSIDMHIKYKDIIFLKTILIILNLLRLLFLIVVKV